MLVEQYKRYNNANEQSNPTFDVKKWELFVVLFLLNKYIPNAIIIADISRR
jgi:hypothetical protein